MGKTICFVLLMQISFSLVKCEECIGPICVPNSYMKSDSGDVKEVSIGVSLDEVSRVDECRGIVTYIGYIYATWNDSRLKSKINHDFKILITSNNVIEF